MLPSYKHAANADSGGRYGSHSGFSHRHRQVCKGAEKKLLFVNWVLLTCICCQVRSQLLYNYEGVPRSPNYSTAPQIESRTCSGLDLPEAPRHLAMDEGQQILEGS